MRNARCVATSDLPFLINSSTIKAGCSPDHAMVYTENGTYTAVRRRIPHHCTRSPPEAMPLPNRGVLSAALCIIYLSSLPLTALCVFFSAVVSATILWPQRTVSLLCHILSAQLFFGLSMYLTGNQKLIYLVTHAFIYGTTQLLQGLPLYSLTSLWSLLLFVFFIITPTPTPLLSVAVLPSDSTCLVLYAVCSALFLLSPVCTSE